MKAKMKKRAIIGHKIACSSQPPHTQSRNGEIKYDNTLNRMKEMESHQFEASNLSNK